jgi:hypothetical protein
LHTETARLRALINEHLALFSDPKFGLKDRAIQQLGEAEAWAIPMRKLKQLSKEKHSFLQSYGYEWALHPDAYNSTYEALLQWRLMNVLSDIDAEHPALERCTNLIVRILPTSCARPHLREIERYRVIILPAGYLSAFKGFIRLWLRGCAIGQSGTKQTATNYREYAANYVAAIQKAEGKMSFSAKAYVGVLFQLLENELPFMDRESIFDEEVLKREDWGTLFGLLATATDGFLLFHEAAHVLAGDTAGTARTLEMELEADRGSASLCIIDEARHGGKGTVQLGSPVFFCVELLRLLCEEILEIKAGRHDPASGRYAGIDELMRRSRVFGDHVRDFLGPMVYIPYSEWNDAVGLVFDTVRWALLDAIGKCAPLSQFVALRSARRIGSV